MNAIKGFFSLPGCSVLSLSVLAITFRTRDLFRKAQSTETMLYLATPYADSLFTRVFKALTPEDQITFLPRC